MAIASCTKGPNYVTKTLDLAFEDYSEDASLESGNQDTKTYIASKGRVQWTSGDKTIYVFDEENNKHAFTAYPTPSGASTTRTFVCNEWPEGQNMKLVVWTGMGNSIMLDNDWNVTGASIKIKNPQALSNTNSFDSGSNITVMKPGSDPLLRSVFGYLRMKNPTYPGTTSAAIKSVVVTADEYISGSVQIDYSGSEPIATLIGDTKENSITINTRWANKKGVGYEPGYLYLVMPVGTYHNVTLEILPFASDPSEKDAATGTAFKIRARNAITIQRGKYTDIGRDLPTEPL